MTRLTSPHAPVADPEFAGRCYGCFRPLAICFCAEIPAIENATPILILQHVRERFHPFNTARIVHKALSQSVLAVDQTPELAARVPELLKPSAGLLYPGEEATLLDSLAPAESPKQLVILDGTWHHAKTFVRDIPALQSLPRYRIAPAEPSRYRIRREPSHAHLSTLEATVAALTALEPELNGLTQLLGAFEAMVDRQLAHPKLKSAIRRRAKRRPPAFNIPSAILGALDNVVVAYGEAPPADRHSKKDVTRLPVYWVAQRLGDEALFGCLVQPCEALPPAALAHMELAAADFSTAVRVDELQTRWKAYVRPTDLVVVYSPSTKSLLDCFATGLNRCLTLKSVHLGSDRRYATLDDVLAGEGLHSDPPRFAGRAGKRLANAIALLRHLNQYPHRAAVGVRELPRAESTA